MGREERERTGETLREVFLAGERAVGVQEGGGGGRGRPRCPDVARGGAGRGQRGGKGADDARARRGRARLRRRPG